MAKGNKKSVSSGPVTVEYKGNKFVIETPEHGIFVLVSADGKKSNKYQLLARSKDTGKNASRLIAGDAAKEMSKKHGLEIREKTTVPRTKTTGKKITAAKMLKLAKLAMKKGATKTEIVEVLGMDPFGESDEEADEEEHPKKAAAKKTAKTTKKTTKKSKAAEESEEEGEASDEQEASEEEPAPKGRKPAAKKGRVVESEASSSEEEEEKPAKGKKAPPKKGKGKKVVESEEDDE